MSSHADRLAALRKVLTEDRLTGFVVPLTDEHMSEYVGAYAQRLAWLTGFEGSAGWAAVLGGKAAVFTDGRYTLQVRDQVSAELFEYQDYPKVQVGDWLGQHAGPGDRIGYDPWLHTKGWVESTAAILKARGAELVAVTVNPIDRVWRDQPEPSPAPLAVHDVAHAGQSSADKRAGIAKWLKEKGADAVVVAALESIAWTLNVRGKDVSRTPVALAFLIVHADASADLYVAESKLTAEVRAHLGADVRCHPREAFEAALGGFGGKAVSADPASCVAAIFAALKDGGACVLEARDPALLPRAIKNPVEIAGTIEAHRRDGAALSRFLAWFDAEAPKGGLTEMSAANKLRQFREQTNQLMDLSFDTISGAGPNAALPHYRVSEASDRPVAQNQIYLVDSGGQYLDGTTDVTRTVIVGEPTAEMKDRFTRVLKGHIALSRAVFPAGTRGAQLDVLARMFLWEAGIDYNHGTGHGVGSYLSVHEGPQRIAKMSGGQAGGDEPLVAGMILSDEPGYYKSGEYGIRVENLVLVEDREIPGAEQPMLGFKPLTLAPIDRRLIDTALLSDAERAWIDAYHAAVQAEVGPQLGPDEQAWLASACAPL
jgi:Xaa-Pro aminopeptidase